MRAEEILPNIDLGNVEVEFQTILDSGKNEKGELKEISWLKSFAAFANGNGGVIVVGVNNKTHQVESLSHEEADAVALLAQKETEARLSPRIRFVVEPIPVGGMPIRYLLLFRVSPSKQKPVLLTYRGTSTAYVRDFGKNSPASYEAIAEMVLSSENVSYESRMTKEVFRGEDFTRLYAHYEEKTKRKLTRKALISKHFMDEEGFLSQGALLFRDDCNLAITRIDMVKYPNISKGGNLLYQTETFVGDLLSGMKAAEDYVASRADYGFEKTSRGRVEVVSFPSLAVHEAIVNAIVHRNYFLSGTQIQVELYPDRLEITSPGKLFQARHIRHEKNIADIAPARRNDVICEVFALCLEMEQQGSGFDKISAEYANQSENLLPFVDSDESSFRLTLPNLLFPGGVIGEENPCPNIRVEGLPKGEREMKILSYCFVSPRSIKEIADYCGFKVSSYAKESILGPLVEEDYLIAGKRARSVVYFANKSKVFPVY